MGTNYYWITNECECCERFDEYDIGEHNFGQVFSFQALDFYHAGVKVQSIRSFADWRSALRSSGYIKDEYGHIVSYEEFIKIVESTKGARLRMAERYPDHSFADSEGYDFTEHDFS